jgi:hypothetical protein
MKKLLAFLIIVFSCCFAVPAKAQHNPYLDKKAKNKPSAVMARQNKKEMRRQKRMARKQMRRSRKRLNK